MNLASACYWSGFCDIDKGGTYVSKYRDKKQDINMQVLTQTKVRDKQQIPILAFALWNFVKEILWTCHIPVNFYVTSAILYLNIVDSCENLNKSVKGPWFLLSLCGTYLV